jgi:acetyl-CoA synthetase
VRAQEAVVAHAETGGIMIANTAAMDIKPGAMGKPLPGIAAGIVAQDGDAVREVPDGEIGELALRPGWPSMMRASLGEPARYAKRFAGGWYLTGDLAMRDGDGDSWFVGQADDPIKSSGHLIGPFEVESALIEHPTVAEAAAIGVPDEASGEVVKAFATPTTGHAPTEALERELRGHARKRLGPAVAPRAIGFRDSLPRTRSGKIMRRLLRAPELGLGDRMKGENRITVCFCGDGALAESGFHEAMNPAALWKLPVFFMLENSL